MNGFIFFPVWVSNSIAEPARMEGSGDHEPVGCGERVFSGILDSSDSPKDAGSLEERGAHLDGIYYCPHHPDIGSLLIGNRAGAESRPPDWLNRRQRNWILTLGGVT